MLIIHGTKIVRRFQGRVPVVCPVCRMPTACRFTNVSRVSHLYFIPIGGGTQLLHELECARCTTVWGVPAGTLESPAKNSRKLEVEQLLAEAPARRVEAITTELDFLSLSPERQAREERLGALARGLLATAYNHGYVKKRRSLGNDVAVLIPVVLVIAALVSWALYTDPTNRIHIFWPVSLSLAFAVSVLSHILGEFRKNRLLSEQSRQRLAASLRPLNPSESELEWLLSVAAAEKATFVKKLTPSQLASVVAHRVAA